MTKLESSSPVSMTKSPTKANSSTVEAIVEKPILENGQRTYTPVTVTTATRSIKYKDLLLADFNPEDSVEAIVKLHAPSFPSLATAYVEGPVYDENGNLVYTVKDRLGTKG